MLQFHRVSHLVRWLFIGVLCLPVLAGAIGVLLPALGYFPALGESTFSLAVFQRLWTVDHIAHMAWMSFFTGFIATAVATLSALCLLSAFYHQAWLHTIQRLLSPLLVLPHAAAAIALLFILSPSGWLARVASLFSQTVLPPQWSIPFDNSGITIIFALALKELPFIFLMALSVLSQPQMHTRITAYLKNAQAMGYAPVTAFLKCALPQLYPHLRLPVLAVLAYATANVEIPLILGSNNPPTLAVAVLQWFNHIELSMRFQASAAAVVQLMVTVVALITWRLVEYSAGRLLRHSMINTQRAQGARRVTLAAWLILVLFTFFAVTMVVSTLVWSFATFWPFPAVLPDGITLLHWQTALPALAEPVKNTLMLGAMVSVLAVIVALLALEAEVSVLPKLGWQRQRLEHSLLQLTLYLPLMVPGVAFLFGLVWFQQRFFSGGIFPHVMLSHLVYVMPYVYISLALPYRRLDPRYVKLAYSLGKSPGQVFWRVKMPLLFGPVLVALGLGMAISFSQYLPTLLSGGGRFATVTTEAVAVASGSSQRLSAVYVIVQAFMPIIVFALAWWLPGRLFNPAAHPRGQQSGVF
ncbi:ABC transporter permease [Alteromonas ponticola]|uniref:ABC transporter permease subunit n=1 Tax=Alteromonas ponticola TaxID=2720613 RepID=A0ABX1R3T9_9ALTE|nr:ABC transporter permease subunit [Alteromonas ponticola]NMH59875.1 ABC transporter permease subunit [Alteromonas ponticola]